MCVLLYGKWGGEKRGSLNVFIEKETIVFRLHLHYLLLFQTDWEGSTQSLAGDTGNYFHFLNTSIHKHVQLCSEPITNNASSPPRTQSLSLSLFGALVTHLVVDDDIVFPHLLSTRQIGLLFLSRRWPEKQQHSRGHQENMIYLVETRTFDAMAV